MTPYFADPEHRDWLLDAAQQLVGTPFAGHQCVPGVGIDCVHSAAWLYHQSRLLPEIPKFGRYNLDGGQHSARNVMGEWLLASPHFSIVWTGEGRFPMPRLGDLVCLHLGRQPWHAAVVIDKGDIIQVHHGSKVGRRPLRDSTWSDRVHHIFRPVVL